MAQHASGTRRLALSGASRVPDRLRAWSAVVSVPELNFSPKARFYFVPFWRNSTVSANFRFSEKLQFSASILNVSSLREQSMTKAEVVVGLLETFNHKVITLITTQESLTLPLCDITI